MLTNKACIVVVDHSTRIQIEKYIPISKPKACNIFNNIVDCIKDLL